MSIVFKILLALIFWGVFIFVIFFIDYPKSLTQASLFQVFPFFISLFLALTFTINIFLKFAVRSALISATIIIFLILQALQTLNLLTFLLTILAFGLLLSYFKKKKGLTSTSKIPKLTSLQRRKR